jgi:hypothetical protein
MLFVKKRAKKDGLRGSMYLAEGLVGAEMSQNQQRVVGTPTVFSTEPVVDLQTSCY